MRLLVVSSWLPYPPDNGSRIRAYHLLQHLGRRHAITLLTVGVTREAGDVARLRAMCERVEVVPPCVAGAGGLGLKGLFSAVPRYYAQTRSELMGSLIAAAAASHDAVLGLQIDVALGLLPATATLPSVLDEIEVGVVRDRYAHERSPVRRLRRELTWWKLGRYVRYLVDRFDRATVVSNLEREHLRRLRCDVDRVAVVPNGMEVPELPPARARAGRLVYPGSVAYSANLDAVRFFIREIFPLIRRARPDLEFAVTGSTEGVDVTDLANAAGVTFTGRLPDVDPLIAESAVCVVPLRVGGGTRLKVLHAMAIGTPVVSTSKGIEGLEVEPDRHVLVADSPERFAEQVLKVVDDHTLGTRLASAGRNLVRERYAWGPIAQTLDQLIQSAVDDRRSGRRGRGGGFSPPGAGI